MTFNDFDLSKTGDGLLPVIIQKGRSTLIQSNIAL